MNLELNEIFAIIDKVKSADIDAFEYQDVDLKIKIKNGKSRVSSGRAKTEYQNQVQTFGQASGTAQADPSGPASYSSQETGQEAVVEAPMVGTFYRAPEEGAQPFINVGDHVKKGQIICIIEAMKLMNEIQANADGIVEEILVENEELVEYGQPLIRIRKN